MSRDVLLCCLPNAQAQIRLLGVGQDQFPQCRSRIIQPAGSAVIHQGTVARYVPGQNRTGHHHRLQQGICHPSFKQ